MFRISRGLKAVGALGAAAVVDGRRISSTELNTAVKQWEQAYTAHPLPVDQLQLTDQTSVPRSVLSRLVAFKLSTVAAQRQGVRVSDGQVDNTIAKTGETQVRGVAVTMGVPPQRDRDLVRFILEGQGIQAQLQPLLKGTGKSMSVAMNNVLSSTARSVRVDVNPRYGKFDYRQLGINPNAGRLSYPETPQLPAQG